MSTASSAEKQRLFKLVRHQLGAPLRKVELTDEQLCSLLEVAIEDYSEYMMNWLIDQQWSSLAGKPISNLDIGFALTTRSLDYVDQFTYAYSKQVGLQARGPYELKKDFVEIKAGQQVYEIPAGREVNEVLWLTAPSIDHAIHSFYGIGDGGFGGGVASLPADGLMAGGSLGYGGYYIAPAFDVLLRASDYNLKHRILRSDLIYKLTAGPNGTRLLHLMSTPGGRIDDHFNGIAGCRVWYFYYETNGNPDQCRAMNPDIIKLPNEVPLGGIDYDAMNEPTKIWVRKYLTAIAKITLGRVRGKFSGQLKVPDAEVTLDYDSLLNEGKEEKEKALEELKERLDKLSKENQLQKKAEEAENINKVLSFKPLGLYAK